jgi:Concanavalin A-like lectin/glucanases superfamily/Peptide-N-glycosidase F, C terminal/Secretion system C-terminal sorting domain
MKYFLLFSILCLKTLWLSSQTADTTVVQTFSHAAQNNPQTAYDSPGRRWFDFPSSDNGEAYQKILMYYNLKCFEQGTAGNLGFPCGEWDYLTYTYLYDHTGVMDSIAAAHPRYLVAGDNFENLVYTSSPIHNFQQHEANVTTLDVVNASYVEVGVSGDWQELPFADHRSARHQYLYRADELADAGLSAGELLQLSLYGQVEDAVDYAQTKVKAKWVTQNTLDQWVNDGLTNVYAASTNFAADGWWDFNFMSPLVWDGVSNLLIEFTYQNPEPVIAPLCASTSAGYDCHIGTGGEERYIVFDGNDRVEVPAAAFADVSDQITIAFWLNGDANAQPMDGTVFEGVGSANQRILNSHLPWSNGRVYWDAGNDGGYDRIDKAAAAANYEGNWNHWAFTKNTTTGVMKIYLNGTQWHTGSNLDNSMEGIVAFAIGAAKSWSNFYQGSIDEFALWNVELDGNTISEWMNRDLNDAHPYWGQLQCFYSFDGALSPYVTDESGNGNDGVIIGNPQRLLYDASSFWRNAAVDQVRPVIRLFNGTGTLTTQMITETHALEVQPSSLTEFAIIDYMPTVVSANNCWTQPFSYVFHADGQIIDSVAVILENSLDNETLNYFQEPFEIVDRYELNRFITMYGIGLDLGDNGWTWVTDVTDFAPLLRDSVELEAGNWQELLDMKFVFIEGTPARDVMRVERVWDGNFNLSIFDQQVTNKTIAKQSGETSWKLLTTNTGHGFGFDNNNCGEFCSNMQSVKVNGVAIESWDIMQECADNPLYPQGGTWVYDRAGWCPGMNSTTKEFELTPHVQMGDAFNVDYDITYDPYGNYVFFGTMIGYGPINHLHDPEIDQVLAPSAQLIHSRWNPICDNPTFVLRNKGALPLNDLNIIFGVEGGVPQTYHWTGNLAFMESEVVELTSLDNALWWGDDEELMTFYINLSFSSDGADENLTNNNASRTFYRPVTYSYSDLDDNRMIIQLKTNTSNQESSYVLYDINDNVVFERSSFPAPNTTYRDTIQLNSGCYMFHLRDEGHDGLSFFANSDGNGNCKLDRVGGLDFINFEADFGKEIVHYFNWNTNLVSVVDLPKENLHVHLYPNPNSAYAMIRTTGLDRQLDVRIVDVMGQLVYEESFNKRYEGDEIRINTDNLADGWYQVWVSDGQRAVQVPMVHIK